MDIETRQKQEEDRIAARANSLFLALEEDPSKSETLLPNIANLIVPTLQKRHLHKRQFEKRTLVIKLGKYEYKIYYENFIKPVKIERKEIELDTMREVM